MDTDKKLNILLLARNIKDNVLSLLPLDIFKLILKKSLIWKRFVRIKNIVCNIKWDAVKMTALTCYFCPNNSYMTDAYISFNIETHCYIGSRQLEYSQIIMCGECRKQRMTGFYNYMSGLSTCNNKEHKHIKPVSNLYCNGFTKTKSLFPPVDMHFHELTCPCNIDVKEKASMYIPFGVNSMFLTDINFNVCENCRSYIKKDIVKAFKKIFKRL